MGEKKKKNPLSSCCQQSSKIKQHFGEPWVQLFKPESQSLTVKLLHLKMQKFDSCSAHVHKAPPNSEDLLEFFIKRPRIFWKLKLLLKTAQCSVVYTPRNAALKPVIRPYQWEHHQVNHSRATVVMPLYSGL